MAHVPFDTLCCHTTHLPELFPRQKGPPTDVATGRGVAQPSTALTTLRESEWRVAGATSHALSK
eukprot:5964132-Pyramimonas_sp.AAC.1